VAEIAWFHPRSGGHRPATQVKMLYSAAALHLFFRVQDRHVRCVHTQPQAPVCRDSCVEFFFEPKPGGGYLNLEANCGGAFLCHHIRDPRRVPGGFADATPLDPAWLARIRVFHSLPARVEPELAGPVEWSLEFSLPLALVEAQVGPLGPLPGQTWRGNFQKCADQTSHPHWATWAPHDAAQPLNFHQPAFFAPLHFAPAAVTPAP
jgi:hypothetical protein